MRLPPGYGNLSLAQYRICAQWLNNNGGIDVSRRCCYAFSCKSAPWFTSCYCPLFPIICTRISRPIFSLHPLDTPERSLGGKASPRVTRRNNGMRRSPILRSCPLLIWNRLPDTEFPCSLPGAHSSRPNSFRHERRPISRFPETMCLERELPFRTEVRGVFVLVFAIRAVQVIEHADFGHDGERSVDRYRRIDVG